MIRFVLARLLSLVPLLVAISFSVFMMMHLLPGDPVVAMLGETGTMSSEGIESLRTQLGLDQPVLVQYVRYVGGLLTLDMGRSIMMRIPVKDLIGQRLRSTFELAFASLFFAVVVGMGLGMLSALHRGTWVDSLAVSFAVLGVSIPSYWLGLMLISIFAVSLGWFHVAAVTGWKGLVLPAVTLGISVAAPIARFTRSGMLEVFGLDFVRTARSKGLAEGLVTVRHVLRNALLPVITLVGLRFGSILAGTVIIESVFVRPGLGLLLLESIRFKDFPVVQGLILFISTAFVLVNLIVEILYARLDPRISYA